jgi:DNA primase
LIIGKIKKPIIIVESDLDALLIAQCSHKTITAISIGSSGAKPDLRMALYLIAAPKILVSLDNDEAGYKASKWWMDRYSNATFWPVPWGKDPGEAFGRGTKMVDKWINAGLKN